MNDFLLSFPLVRIEVLAETTLPFAADLFHQWQNTSKTFPTAEARFFLLPAYEYVGNLHHAAKTLSFEPGRCIQRLMHGNGYLYDHARSTRHYHALSLLLSFLESFFLRWL